MDFDVRRNNESTITIKRLTDGRTDRVIHHGWPIVISSDGRVTDEIARRREADGLVS